MKVQEIIETLTKTYKPDDDLLITWWSDADFADYKDIDQAYELAEQQLDSCIGHVNEWVESQYSDEEEE